MLFQSILKICQISVLRILVFSSCFALLCYLHRQSRWSSTVTSPWALLVDWHPQSLWIIHTVSKRAVPNLNHLSGSCLQPLQTFHCHFTLNDSIPEPSPHGGCSIHFVPRDSNFLWFAFLKSSFDNPWDLHCVLYVYALSHSHAIVDSLLNYRIAQTFSCLSHIQKSNSELKINCSAIWIQPKISGKDAPLLTCSTYWQMEKCCMIVSEY